MKYEIHTHDIFWIDGVPAFQFKPDNTKDPMTPTGWSWYIGHKEEIDKWILKNRPFSDNGSTRPL